MRRRLLLKGGAALCGLLLAPKHARGAAPDPALARESLAELIGRYAVPDPNPWVAMHVVLALGADAKRGKVPILASTISETLRVEEVGMRRYPYFPLAVERHRFHFVQILQAIGVPPERVFVTPLGRWTHEELVQGACALMDPQAPEADEDSWAVSVLSHQFPPSRDTFTTARGETVDVSRLVAEHVRATESAYAAVYASMQGQGYRRNTLHRRACSGLHLLYGVIEARAAGYTVAGLEDALPRLLRATLFRARLEAVLIDRSFPPAVPMAQLNADSARLTFFGHLAEDFGRAIELGLFAPDKAQRATLVWVRDQLSAVVMRLAQQHDLDALAAAVPRAFHVLLGDLCHAYRGFGLLDRALEERS